MQYLYLSEDDEGVSYFEDADIALAVSDFAPPAPAMLVSEPMPASRCLFLTLPVGWGGAKHRSPCRQIAFCLSGRLRVIAGDGETREISVGGIWRMEDVAGSGHKTDVTGDEPVRLAIVQLA